MSRKRHSHCRFIFVLVGVLGVVLGIGQAPAFARGSFSRQPKRAAWFKNLFKRRLETEQPHKRGSQLREDRPMGPLIVTDQNIPVPADVVRYLTTFLSPSDAGNFGATCSAARRVTAPLRPGWEAQDRVYRLVGDLIQVKGGTFVLKEEVQGIGEEEAGEETARVVRVKPLRVQAQQLTQGQYEFLMGTDSLLPLEMRLHDLGLDPKKFRGKELPIFALTVEQENAYILKLNQEIERIWEGSQLKGRPPRFRRLSDDERLFLATRDVAPKKRKVDNEVIEITAEIEASPIKALPPARVLADGPWAVRSSVLEGSARGFYGLVGNLMERTSTPGPVPGSLRVRGGLFDKDAESNDAFSHAFIEDDDFDVQITLRLGLDEA